MAATVLIVDDHAGCRRAARALLEDEGFEVVAEEASGREALAAAEALRPGIVVLDVGLPDVDGIEVARRLTAGGHPSPTVVLTSSRDPADLAEVAAGCGACGLIAKDELSGTAIAALAT
jgi:DNA-binding NarL/FixJ family response regulator